MALQTRLAAHYGLGHGNCTPKLWQCYQDLLKIGWSQTWSVWHIPPVGGGGFPCPRSLPDVIVLEKVTPPPDPLAPCEAPGDELSKQYRRVEQLASI